MILFFFFILQGLIPTFSENIIYMALHDLHFSGSLCFLRAFLLGETGQDISKYSLRPLGYLDRIS